MIIKEIFQGWKNFILDKISDIKYKSIFNNRYEICSECEHNVHGICKICKCILKAKTKAEDSECPIGKWETISKTVMTHS